MPAVVVLPWVPATASTQRSRSTKSCSHCGPDIGNIIFQHRFNARVAASHGVTDDHQVRPGLQLAGVIALN